MRGDRVELVRVVEHRGLGRPGRAPVVVDGDGVDELGERVAVELGRPRLDQPDPELDVAQESALLGRSKGRRTAELECPADVVEQRRRYQQVRPQPRMHLCAVPADRRHRDGVLEQSAGVVVVEIRARGELAEPDPEPLVVRGSARRPTSGRDG